MSLNQLKNSRGSECLLPAIPDKRYFTIGEVGHLCGVKPHVLRYWEMEFPSLKPTKRRGNRRYYQYKDVMMARQIRKLLYEEGFTIEGARGKLLNSIPLEKKSVELNTIMKKVIVDLEKVLQKLKMENVVR